MKYLKLFEDRYDDEYPEVGDYVVCEVNSGNDKDSINEKIKNKIGKIKSIKNNMSYPYSIEYDFPVLYGLCELLVSYREIIAYAKTKEELQLKIAAKKYNL